MQYNNLLYSEEVAIAGVNGAEGGFIHVRADGMSLAQGGNYCQDFVVKIFGTDGTLIQEGEVHGPASGQPAPAIEGLHAVVSFLLACAEAPDETSENYGLYPTATREWAELYSDELQLISLEIEEETGVLDS